MFSGTGIGDNFQVLAIEGVFPYSLLHLQVVASHVKIELTALNIGLKIFFRYSSFHVTFLQFATTRFIEGSIQLLDRRRS